MPAQPSQPDLAVPVGEADHRRGGDDAPVTLVEYGDYECPTCRASFPEVEALLERHGGRVRFAFRHFPLTSVHPGAGVAAQAAEAAGAQGKFWEMHALLYREPGGPAVENLDRLALRLGLEVYRFQGDLTTAAHASRVAADAEGGRRSGVRGTPTFFVNGRRLPPAASGGAALEDAVDEALAGQNPAVPTAAG